MQLISLNEVLFLTVITFTPKISESRYSIYRQDGEELLSDGYGYDGYPPYGGGLGGYHEPGVMSDWSNHWPVIHGAPPRCIDIPSNLTLCHGIGYDQMRLPNLLEHDTLREVTSQAATWVNLLNINCHPDTRLFLCSLFTPVCLDRPIYPCRRLCESVKAGCVDRMLKYGFPWPDMLKCDQFPLDNDLCISSQSENKEEAANCAACDQPNTFQALVDNFCRADVVIRTKLRREIESNGEKKILVGKKKRIYKKGDLRKRDLDSLEVFVENSQKCDCGLPAEGHEKDYYFIMGNKRGNKLYAKALHIYDKKNRDMKKALRAIRKKDNICNKKGLEFLAINDEPLVPKNNKQQRKGLKMKKSAAKKNEKGNSRQSVGYEYSQAAVDQTTKAYIASTTARIIAPSAKKSSSRKNKSEEKKNRRRGRKRERGERNPSRPA